jgi:hypothetical protein
MCQSAPGSGLAVIVLVVGVFGCRAGNARGNGPDAGRGIPSSGGAGTDAATGRGGAGGAGGAGATGAIAVGATGGTGAGATSGQGGGGTSGRAAGGVSGGGVGSAGRVATGGDGSAGTGGTQGSDSCNTNSDCPTMTSKAGAPCPSVCALGMNGFRECAIRCPLMLFDDCGAGAPVPCCRANSDCSDKPGGECIPNAMYHCGPGRPQGSQCYYGCQSDADCTVAPHGVCDAGYPRTCHYGPCRTNADCTQREGGTCVLGVEGQDPSCQTPVVYCRYSGDPCGVNGDCQPDAGFFVCVPNENLRGARCLMGIAGRDRKSVV